MNGDLVPHPTRRGAERPWRHVARGGLAGVVLVTGPVLLVSTLLKGREAKPMPVHTTQTGTTLASARAESTAFCDPSVQDCGPPPAALFAQLNSDITALFPPSPIKPEVVRMATQAESAFPGTPLAPSDFCPSYAQFGALADFVTGQSQNRAFPPNPFVVILGDIATIRSAPIWAMPALPPSPCISG